MARTGVEVNCKTKSNFIVQFRSIVFGSRAKSNFQSFGMWPTTLRAEALRSRRQTSEIWRWWSNLTIPALEQWAPCSGEFKSNTYKARYSNYDTIPGIAFPYYDDSKQAAGHAVLVVNLPSVLAHFLSLALGSRPALIRTTDTTATPTRRLAWYQATLLIR